MIRINRRSGRAIALSLVVATVTGCALPRTGPTKNEIFEGSVQNQGDAFIVTVDDRVTKMTGASSALGFPERLINAATLGSDTIRPGDTLTVEA